MTKHESDSASSIVLAGTPPAQVPARVADFEELEKKTLDVLVDAQQYIATTCGIAIAMYAQSMRQYLDYEFVKNRASAQITLFFPLLLWLASIVATVIGIFPREHTAHTDLEKELVIKNLRKTKRRWLRLALAPFIAGFSLFVYIIAAQIFKMFPFR